MLGDMRKRIQGAIMRCLFVALGLAGMIFDAVAADLPTLRGSDALEAAFPVYPRWQGSYFGGQVGYSHSHMNLSGGYTLSAFSSSLTAPLGSVASWAAFGPRDVNAINYGAFVGYNNQWDEVVLGVEANYNHTPLTGSATASRFFPDITLGDGFSYDVAAS